MNNGPQLEWGKSPGTRSEYGLTCPTHLGECVYLLLRARKTGGADDLAGIRTGL